MRVLADTSAWSMLLRRDASGHGAAPVAAALREFLETGVPVFLTGVISFIADTDGRSNSDYGDVSGFGRVSRAYPWITTVVPEPSTNALLAVGAFVMIAAWLRRRPSTDRSR